MADLTRCSNTHSAVSSDSLTHEVKVRSTQIYAILFSKQESGKPVLYRDARPPRRPIRLLVTPPEVKSGSEEEEREERKEKDVDESPDSDGRKGASDGSVGFEGEKELGNQVWDFMETTYGVDRMEFRDLGMK
jgi:hypothetical protein